MSKIIVPRGQQEAVAREYPKLAYSRVINLTLQVPAGAGETDHAVTPPIGNRVWLLNVKMNFMSQTRASVFGGFVYISTGTAKEVNPAKIAGEWEPVIKQIGGPKPAFYYTGFGESYSWDMMKFYEGHGRRFGAVAENLSADQTWRLWVSFEISEG
ncbi:MAG: hypothetical protein HWN68_14985 [Desulfobacterales bacterium]|nr:hypothetical protein [Desulfobacterales bacterium]